MTEQEPGFDVPEPEMRMLKEQLEEMFPEPESSEEFTYSELRSEYIEKVGAVALKSRPRGAVQKRTQSPPK